MDIQKLLHTAIQTFISDNLDTDISKLALKKRIFSEVNYAEIINQIISKRKAKEKLPTWFATENIIYPEKISIEQTSSEITAKYKASLLEGDLLFDATGGFGIDDYYFSKKFKKVYHCEINPSLSDIVAHNFKQFQINSVTFLKGNSTEFLNQLNQTFDIIYVDPSRRSDQKGRVFQLADCLPNIVAYQEFYFSFTNTIMVKTAPILDIKAGMHELHNVKEIHIVAVKNEVKELLWILEKNWTNSPKLYCVNFEKQHFFKQEMKAENNLNATFSLPQKFLYEPNASLLKSGCFEAISALYSVNKLHQHSHLYTSQFLQNFHGRRFEIIKEIPYQKSELKAYIANQKLNISTRNFPLKVEEIKKKHKITDGGAIYAFFTTNLNDKKTVLLCKKIKNHD